MGCRNRRHFILYIPRFRYYCSQWLAGLTGSFPSTVMNILMHSDWDTFFKQEVGLRLGVFATVLYFFASNRAPVYLRQMFWYLLLQRPVFEESGGVGDDHPYIVLFDAFSRLPSAILAGCGAFYNMQDGDMYHEVGSKFDAYNVWGCRGVYSEGLGGLRRRLYTEMLFHYSGENHDLMGWDSFCLLSPEMILKNLSVDCYPWNRTCNEKAVPAPPVRPE